MGYFVTKHGESWQNCLDAVVGNIHLIKTAGDIDYDYLFDFAEGYLKEAKQKYIENRKNYERCLNCQKFVLKTNAIKINDRYFCDDYCCLKYKQEEFGE